MDRITNLTPYPVCLITDTGAITFQSEGHARVQQQVTQMKSLLVETPDGESTRAIPTIAVYYDEIVGLPTYDDRHLWPQLRGVVDKKWYIVTGSVVCAVRASGDLRDDLLTTGELVRSVNNHILGCKSLRRA